MDQIKDLQVRLETLTRKVEDLSSREEIREVIYRINRGMDRIDQDLMASGFHPDAKVRWGTPQAMDLSDWVEQAIKMQHTTSRVQHLVGNILIEFKGETANVESYEIGRHLTPMGDEKKDLIIAARYIDQFARRDGVWRITRRDKVGDWIRIMEGVDPLYEHIPLKGLRDGSDISFEVFGPDAFRPG